ncbi:MAG: hypothetical protein EBR82_58500 [Caulobacteraceae bacterium]|nr:hypothetical protein [Caulobacteraceae bacterium]
MNQFDHLHQVNKMGLMFLYQLFHQILFSFFLKYHQPLLMQIINLLRHQIILLFVMHIFVPILLLQE